MNYFPSFNYILSLFNELWNFECQGVWSPCSTSFNTYILKLGDECFFTSSFFFSYNKNFFNIITPHSYYNLCFLWNKYIYQIGLVLCRLLFYYWNLWILMLHIHMSQLWLFTFVTLYCWCLIHHFMIFVSSLVVFSINIAPNSSICLWH